MKNDTPTNNEESFGLEDFFKILSILAMLLAIGYCTNSVFTAEQENARLLNENGLSDKNCSVEIVDSMKIAVCKEVRQEITTIVPLKNN